jgi:hypothetical protein
MQRNPQHLHALYIAGYLPPLAPRPCALTVPLLGTARALCD